MQNRPRRRAVNPNDATWSGPHRLRTSDSEREQVAEILRAAMTEGRLTLEEKHRFLNPNGRMNGHLHWNLLAQWEELKTEKHPQSITLNDDPYVLIRPEGRWDTPGILERSASRGVCESGDMR